MPSFAADIQNLALCSFRRTDVIHKDIEVPGLLPKFRLQPKIRWFFSSSCASAQPHLQRGLLRGADGHSLGTNQVYMHWQYESIIARPG